MEGVLILLAVGLATWQVVEVLHHSLIALPMRRQLAAAAEGGGASLFLFTLISCPFCLSNWVAVLLTLGWYNGGTFMKATLLGVAAARLANLGNDLTKQWSLTPKYYENEEVMSEAGGEPGEDAVPRNDS